MIRAYKVRRATQVILGRRVRPAIPAWVCKARPERLEISARKVLQETPAQARRGRQVIPARKGRQGRPVMSAPRDLPVLPELSGRKAQRVTQAI